MHMNPSLAVGFVQSANAAGRVSSGDMKRRLFAVALSTFIAIAATAAQLPDFMTGSWAARAADGSVTEEHWMSASGNTMLGMSRTVGADRKVASFEFLRVAQYQNTIAYYAMPEGRAAVAFPLKALTANKVVFENLKHDFPQRIIYWTSEGNLCARIEGTIGGKASGEEWCWTRK